MLIRRQSDGKPHSMQIVRPGTRTCRNQSYSDSFAQNTCCHTLAEPHTQLRPEIGTGFHQHRQIPSAAVRLRPAVSHQHSLRNIPVSGIGHRAWKIPGGQCRKPAAHSVLKQTLQYGIGWQPNMLGHKIRPYVFTYAGSPGQAATQCGSLYIQERCHASDIAQAHGIRCQKHVIGNTSQSPDAVMHIQVPNSRQALRRLRTWS